MIAASLTIAPGRGGVASPGLSHLLAPWKIRMLMLVNTYLLNRRETLILGSTLENAAEWNPALISPYVRETDLKFMSTHSRKGRKCLRVIRTFYPPLKDPAFTLRIPSRHAFSF